MRQLEEEEELPLFEKELGDVELNSTGQKASDFEPKVEVNYSNNVELREHVMHNEDSTDSTPLLSRICRRVDESETDVSGGNFKKPTEEMSPFAKQTRVSSQLFTSPERWVRLSTQFTPTSSIIGDGFSFFPQRSLIKLKMREFDGKPSGVAGMEKNISLND